MVGVGRELSYIYIYIYIGQPTIDAEHHRTEISNRVKGRKAEGSTERRENGPSITRLRRCSAGADNTGEQCVLGGKGDGVWGVEVSRPSTSWPAQCRQVGARTP